MKPPPELWGAYWGCGWGWCCWAKGGGVAWVWAERVPEGLNEGFEDAVGLPDERDDLWIRSKLT